MKGNTMASEQLTIKINGKDTPAPAGALLLHVLRDVGVDVPTLCHDERLTPYGGCRLCVVARRDGRGGLVPSCSTPVQRGMEIETDTPEVEPVRVPAGAHGDVALRSAVGVVGAGVNQQFELSVREFD